MKKTVILILASFVIISLFLEAETEKTFSTKGWWKPAGTKFYPVGSNHNSIQFHDFAKQLFKDVPQDL